MSKKIYFNINDMVWSIEKKSQKEIKALVDSCDDNGTYFGLTVYSTHSVYLWDGLCEEQAERTLMHELMHVYVFSYITSDSTKIYSEEDLCDISANSHDIIEDIVKKYVDEFE